METMNQWIDNKLSDLATRLPSLVHSEPASFACGYNAGYKNALLDLKGQIDIMIELKE